MMHEIIHFAKKSGMEVMLLKLDMNKAFDKVLWEFLELVMAKFGFHVE